MSIRDQRKACEVCKEQLLHWSRQRAGLAVKVQWARGAGDALLRSGSGD